ncbi:unnamed protein product, partial [Mesocestoides corti]
RLIVPNGPAIGAAVFLGDDGEADSVLRLGSLVHLTLNGGTNYVQLRAIFDDNCESHRLRVLRDTRLLLAVPLEEAHVEGPGKSLQPETPCTNPPLRCFKPIKFSPQGSLACVAFSKPEGSITTPGDTIILCTTITGIMIVHFASDTPLKSAVFAIEKLNLPA